jgi:hypothetical protein
MNYEESVKAVYPSAKCYIPGGHILIQNHQMFGEYFIYHRYEYGKFFKEAEVLSSYCQTEDLAWQDAWEFVEQEMLKKLES